MTVLLEGNYRSAVQTPAQSRASAKGIKEHPQLHTDVGATSTGCANVLITLICPRAIPKPLPKSSQHCTCLFDQAGFLKNPPYLKHCMPQQATQGRLLSLFSHGCFSPMRTVSVTCRPTSLLLRRSSRSFLQSDSKTTFGNSFIPATNAITSRQIICEQAGWHSSRTVTSLLTASPAKTIIHNLCFPSPKQLQSQRDPSFPPHFHLQCYCRCFGVLKETLHSQTASTSQKNFKCM